MEDIFSQESTKEQVANYFLKQLNSSEEDVNIIIKEDISGEVLAYLDYKDFLDLKISYGVYKKMKKKKILENIKSNFKEKQIDDIITPNSKQKEVKAFFQKYLNFNKDINLNGKELLELSQEGMKNLHFNLGQKKKLEKYIDFFKKISLERVITWNENSSKEEIAIFLDKILSFSQESIKKLNLNGEDLSDLIKEPIEELNNLLGYISEKEMNNLIEYIKQEKNKNDSEKDFQENEDNETEINNEDNIEKISVKVDKEKNLEEKEKENGIIFKKPYPKEFDYININIKLKNDTNIKEIEIYNILMPDKEGYKFIEFEKNIYFSVCPIYHDIKLIKFGIRDELKEKVDEDKMVISYNDNLQYVDAEGGYFQIMKDNEKGYNFEIYNEPELTEDNILLYLEKLCNLKIYEFNAEVILRITINIDYKKILDLILRIGIENEKLINYLIETLKKKYVEVNQVSKYLNRNQNMNNFGKIAPFIIYKINETDKKLKNEKKKKNVKTILQTKNGFYVAIGI